MKRTEIDENEEEEEEEEAEVGMIFVAIKLPALSLLLSRRQS